MLLGLDLGTGSVKALLLAPDGSGAGESSISYPVRSPGPGWAESHPEEWWGAVGEAAREAVGSRGPEVTALGLSGQMHGVVLSGADGRPLRPAILWADARSTGQLDAYRSLDEDARTRLANPPAAGMAGPTLLWLRDNEPGMYGEARWVLQPKDWLRLRLTGEAAAEPSDASATLLYDLRDDGWYYGVAETLGLRTDFLAPLVPSSALSGWLTREAAEHLGVRVGLPVAAGAGDTAAAMLGSGLAEPGLMQLTVGTGAQIVAPVDRPDPDPCGRTHLYRAATPKLFYAMAAIQNAGLALEWTRRVLGASWEEVYDEAFAVPAGSEGASFLPHLSGERTPHLDPGARGAWTGLGLGHGRGHLLRAALEGVAFALREGLEALEEAGVSAPELRLAGGGATREPWRRLLANVLERPLRLLPETAAANASARGAALLAGVASGIYASVEDTFTLAPELQRTVYPDVEASHYGAAYARYKEIYPRLRDPDAHSGGSRPDDEANLRR